MLEYPSIAGIKNFPLGNNCTAFYKYDGSNLRFEWDHKNGWNKFGSRTQMIDLSHPIFGTGIKLFKSEIGDIIIDKVRENNYKNFKNIKKITAFAEFYGEQSFAGTHVEDDKKYLKLFDINLFKSGFIQPQEFLEMFQDLDFCSQVVYTGKLNEEFIKKVRENKLEILLNEGVICKGLNDIKKVQKYGAVWMTKIKTFNYLNKLKNTFNDEWEKFGE